MTDAPVLFSTEGAIARIMLNRPEQRNAVNLGLADALSEAIARFEGDDALRVAILHGAGRVFCSGMDLAAFADGQVSDVLFRDGGFCGLTEARRTKPLIAAVHGAAVAGGFELALACDMIVAEEDTRFGLPEVIRGLVAGAGAALRLSQIISPARAREILLTGQLFDTDTAWEIGLLTRRAAAGQGLAVAQTLAETIAANAPLAVRETLRLSYLAEDAVAADLWQENARTLRSIMDSADAAEGASAFLEKRLPVWIGQ